MPDYERLLDSGSAGLKRSLVYPILDADFGDGFYASILIGDAAGVREFQLTWNNVHRDHTNLVQPLTFNNNPVGGPVTRFKYMLDFVGRRFGAGNTPFWFLDVDAKTGFRTDTLCRFLPGTFTQQQDRRNGLLYQYSIQFRQIRGAPAQT